MNKYEHYFRDHYKVNFSENDIKQWCTWFYGEWRLIKKHMKLKHGMHVLDIGAGSGGFFEVLKKEGIRFKYVGLDLDQAIVEFANKHFKTDSFKMQQFEDHIAKKKYDLLVAFEVLEHVHNPTQFVEKIYNDTKKGGAFCGTTPYPFKKNIVSDATHISVLHPDNWRRLFVDAGFRNVVIKPMAYAPFLWRLHPKLNIRLPFHVRLPGFVSTTLIYAQK